MVDFNFGRGFRVWRCSGGRGGFESVRRPGVRVGSITTVGADGFLLWAYKGDWESVNIGGF